MSKKEDIMWAYKQTDEIYHHGILGMKWRSKKISK